MENMKANETISTYEVQANEFMSKYKVEIVKTFKKFGSHFEGEKEKRDIYTIEIKRGSRVMKFDFGQSLVDSGVKVVNKNSGKVVRVFGINEVSNKGIVSRFEIERRLKYSLQSCDRIELPKEPTNYDILACLTKYEVGTFEDFCSNFGYDEDSRKAERIYKAVCKEWADLQTLFSDEELTELADIN